MTIRVRQFAALQYADPIECLLALREIERSPELQLFDEPVRRLRTNGLRGERESRIAYLFAAGMQARFGIRFGVAAQEGEDFDFVVRTVVEDETIYVPVQLKELAPADLNSSQTLEELFLGVQRRPLTDTVLLVHLNRRTQIDVSILDAARAPFQEVWFVWASSPAQSEWMLYGDVLNAPTATVFPYPERQQR